MVCLGWPAGLKDRKALSPVSQADPRLFLRTDDWSCQWPHAQKSVAMKFPEYLSAPFAFSFMRCYSNDSFALWLLRIPDLRKGGFHSRCRLEGHSRVCVLSYPKRVQLMTYFLRSNSCRARSLSEIHVNKDIR